MVRYTRFALIAVALVALPGSALAQPAPAVPPAQPAPAVPPAPPTPALPAMPELPVFDVDLDFHIDKEPIKIDKERIKERVKADMDRLKVDIERLKEDKELWRAGLDDFKANLAFEFAQGPKPVVGGPGPKPGAGRGSRRQQRGSQLSERHARARQRPMGRGRAELHAGRESERHARRRSDVLDRVGAEQAGQRRCSTRMAGSHAKDVSRKPLGDRSTSAGSRDPAVGRAAGAARERARRRTAADGAQQPRARRRTARDSDAREDRQRHGVATPQRTCALCTRAERIAGSTPDRHQDRSRRESRSPGSRRAASRRVRRCRKQAGASRHLQELNQCHGEAQHSPFVHEHGRPRSAARGGENRAAARAARGGRAAAGQHGRAGGAGAALRDRKDHRSAAAHYPGDVPET